MDRLDERSLDGGALRADLLDVVRFDLVEEEGAVGNTNSLWLLRDAVGRPVVQDEQRDDEDEREPAGSGPRTLGWTPSPPRPPARTLRVSAHRSLMVVHPRPQRNALPPARGG